MNNEHCVSCGAELPEGAKFCPGCGTKRPEAPKPAFCVNCGTKLESRGNFCPNCGTPLAAAAAPAIAAEPARETSSGKPEAGADTKQQDYDRIIAGCGEAIGLNAGDAEAYKNRGDAYKGKEDYDRAIADYSEAIRLKADYAEAYVNRGFAYSEKEEYDRAIADCNEALRLKADYAEAYVNRGLAYKGKEEYDRAIADCNEALRLKADYADAYNNCGILYYKEKNYDQAIAAFNEAVRLAPNVAVYYNNCGVLYRGRKEYDKAIAAFSEAIRVKPDYAAAYNQRGYMYCKKGDYDRAIADYSEIIRLGTPDIRSWWKNIRNIKAFKTSFQEYFRQWDLEAMITHYEEALRQNPDDAGVCRNCAWAHLYHFRKSGENMMKYGEHYERALSLYGEAIRLEPGNAAKTHCLRGDVYAIHVSGVDSGDRKGIGEYSEAIRLNPDCAEAYGKRGRMAAEWERDFDRAIADYSEVIRLKPNDAEAYFLRGLAWDMKNDYDRAIAGYSEAIGVNPGFADAYYCRGEAYERGCPGGLEERPQDYDHAFADYSEVIRLNPNNPGGYVKRGDLYRYIKKDYERAAADYSEAIRLRPSRGALYFERGHIYFDMADSLYPRPGSSGPAGRQDNAAGIDKAIAAFDLAKTDYESALSLDPENYHIKKPLGAAKYRIKELKAEKKDARFRAEDREAVESYNINMKRINKLIKKYGEPTRKGATDDLDRKYYEEAMKYPDEQDRRTT